MGTNGKIVDLRTLLAERFPSPSLVRPELLSTGLSALDPITGGGLPKGAVTELISPSLSAGSASLIAALIQSAHDHRYFIALVDGCDSFDPEPLGNSCLRHLLWVRCRTPLESVKAADLLLRDGNFPLVVIDLVLNSATEMRKIPQTSWYRLQRLVEPTSTAFLVLTRYSTVSSAHLKIVLENQWTLQTFAQENAVSSLRIRIRRSHLGQTPLDNFG
ncbi:MAG: recombination protein RecA [Verrucomicrobiota bacterium]|jgi:hypothetical protein